MRYPDDFNTPAFPAGKRIIVARLMAIGISIGLLLIVFLGGMILWTASSHKIDPFLISVTPTTGAWKLIGHDHSREHSASYLMQESLVRNFVENWFAVSTNSGENDIRWEICDASLCQSDEYRGIMASRCALACISSPELMDDFVYDVVPTYQGYADNGMAWAVDTNTLDITPVAGADSIKEDSGAWQVTGTILTNTGHQVDIMAFATIARAPDQYPKTMGFYVTSFYAYKINR